MSTLHRCERGWTRVSPFGAASPSTLRPGTRVRPNLGPKLHTGSRGHRSYAVSEPAARTAECGTTRRGWDVPPVRQSRPTAPRRRESVTSRRIPPRRRVRRTARPSVSASQSQLFHSGSFADPLVEKPGPNPVAAPFGRDFTRRIPPRRRVRRTARPSVSASQSSRAARGRPGGTPRRVRRSSRRRRQDRGRGSS